MQRDWLSFTPFPGAVPQRSHPRVEIVASEEHAVPPELGRLVLLIGIVLVVVGGLSALGVRLPIGRLPGDIAIEGKNGGFYFPLNGK